MDHQGLDAALALARKKKQLPAPPVRRHLRKGAGLSQLVVAHAIGVTKTAVSLWESGRREPRGENLVKYLALLDHLAQKGLR
jgi:DNA-binding transcriptional regulator YiaG